MPEPALQAEIRGVDSSMAREGRCPYWSHQVCAPASSLPLPYRGRLGLQISTWTHLGCTTNHYSSRSPRTRT